jgi:hypothetical protein
MEISREFPNGEITAYWAMPQAAKSRSWTEWIGPKRRKRPMARMVKLGRFRRNPTMWSMAARGVHLQRRVAIPRLLREPVMATQLFGEPVSDQAYENWTKLSNADKLTLEHAHRQQLEERAAEAKRASAPDKPANWDRLSPSDRRTWFHGVGRT